MIPAEELLGDEEGEPPHGCRRLVSRRIRPERRCEDGIAGHAGEKSQQDHHSNIDRLVQLDSIVYSIHSLPHARPNPVDWCLSPFRSHFAKQTRTYTCGAREHQAAPPPKQVHVTLPV